mgnify:CR=1 FL=1
MYNFEVFEKRMKSRGRAAILIVFATLAISTVAVDEFVPTEEFQDVQEGQALPGVRL